MQDKSFKKNLETLLELEEKARFNLGTQRRKKKVVVKVTKVDDKKLLQALKKYSLQNMT